jgi:hypothetical protein
LNVLLHVQCAVHFVERLRRPCTPLLEARSQLSRHDHTHTTAPHVSCPDSCVASSPAHSRQQPLPLNSISVDRAVKMLQQFSAANMFTHNAAHRSNVHTRAVKVHQYESGTFPRSRPQKSPSLCRHIFIFFTLENSK